MVSTTSSTVKLPRKASSLDYLNLMLMAEMTPLYWPLGIFDSALPG